MNYQGISIPQFERQISFIERCEKVDEYHRIGKESLNTEEMTRTCLKLDQDNQESIPIFTKCKTLEQMKIQSDLFTQQETQYTRLSIIHVQSMIHDNFEATIIMKFMKSISVIIKTQSTKFLIDKNPDLQEIYKKKVTRNPDISTEGYKKFVNCWDQVYNEKSTLSKDIIKEENLEGNKNVEWQRLYFIIRKQHWCELQQQQCFSIQLCKIKYPKQITRQPNQNIIIGKMGNQELPIDSKYKIFYNYTHTYKVQPLQRFQERLYNEPQAITYEGSLDLSGLEQAENGTLRIGPHITYQGQFSQGIFNGNGKLILQFGYLEGDFQNGYAHGTCRDYYGKGEYSHHLRHGQYIDRNNNVSYYDQGKQVQYLVKMRNQKPVIPIANFGLNFIDDFCFQSLLPGNSLQMDIIDYYLDVIQHARKIISIQIINTYQSQDIFGNLIRRNQFSKHIEIKHYQYDRIIFVICVGQGHFITIAYEDYCYYIFDSLNSKHGDLISNLHQLMNLKESQTRIVYQMKNQQFAQNNSFDGGLYAIFNAYKLYKCREIQNIKFDQDYVNIRNIRKQIKSIIEDNYATLDIL